jgi:hypothetical protein
MSPVEREHENQGGMDKEIQNTEMPQNFQQNTPNLLVRDREVVKLDKEQGQVG